MGEKVAMIDFIKARVNEPNFVGKLLRNDLLAFNDLFNKVGYRIGKTAIYRGLTFNMFDSGLVEIEGSLHKFWNYSIKKGELQNWNDFHRLDLYDTIHEFSTQFCISPDKVRLHNVEYGVNVILPIEQSATDLLRRLLNYKSHKFSEKKS